MSVFYIPCEVYDTRSQAVEALACDPGQSGQEGAPPLSPTLVAQEVRGVTCVAFDFETWSGDEEIMKPMLRSLVTEHGRTRIVLDFSGQHCVGSASIGCIYCLWRALSKAGGRFAMCHLSARLLEFFRWHDRGRLTFPKHDQ